VGEIGLLSRAIAGISEKSLIVALPGSPNAVSSGIEILHPILPHILKLVRGN
jgi:molybdopterin biosynthesis enzyme MoaB